MGTLSGSVRGHQTIFSRRALGATYAAIADELSALGVSTASGSSWYGTTVCNYEQRLQNQES